jgi:hypothetical protein
MRFLFWRLKNAAGIGGLAVASDARSSGLAYWQN